VGAAGDCALCPHDCHIDRRQTTRGAVCRTGERAVVASFGPHFGEECCLVGTHGSGTIFFSWCNLRCQFCQNYDISQVGAGAEADPEDIASMMLHLQTRGCHNINFVTRLTWCPKSSPRSAWPPNAAAAPLVYNTGGYDAMAAWPCSMA